MKRLTVFISYSTKNARIASAFKTAFDELGCEAYLAHDDLNDSAKWRKSIAERIRAAHLFIPVVTREFLGSFEANQEVGIALALKRPMSAFFVGVQKDCGVLLENQGTFVRRKDIHTANHRELAKNKIMSALRAQPHLKVTAMHSVIEKLSHTSSNYQRRDLAEILASMDRIIKKDARAIFRRVMKDGSFATTFIAEPFLRQVFSANRRYITPPLRDKILFLLDTMAAH